MISPINMKGWIPMEQQKKPFFKKRWFWIGLAILFAFSLFSPTEDEKKRSSEEEIAAEKNHGDDEKIEQEEQALKEKEEELKRKEKELQQQEKKLKEQEKKEQQEEEKKRKQEEKEQKQREKEKQSSKLPVINERAIDHAYSIMNGYDMVRDSHIAVDPENQTITLAIIVGAATNEEHAKDLGDNFTRALASGVAIYSEEDYRSPTKHDLGELYDYYDLHVGVGTSPDHFIARGAKVTASPKITW